MKTFEIEIVEVLRRTVTVEADDVQDAIEIAQALYDDGEVVLDYDDHVSTDINPLKED